MESESTASEGTPLGQMTPSDAAALKEKFQQMYAELISKGMSPNDAVAEALTNLHRTTATSQPPAPVQGEENEAASQDMEVEEIVKPVALTLELVRTNSLALAEMKKLVYDAFSDSELMNTLCFPNHSRPEIQHGLAILTTDTVLSNIMTNALHSWVNQTWTNSKKWTQPSDLHQFWVVLEHPLLFDPEYRQVVGGMAKLMYYLSDSMKANIQDRWATTYDSDSLHRLVDVFHQYITLSLMGSELKMDMIFATCEMLSILHRINESIKPFCSYTDFYNDAVNSELNLLTDYAKSAIFMVRKHQNVVLHRELSELSFCDFPFVLDAASKSLILHFDAEYQQRTTVNDSIRNSIASLENLMPYLVLRVRREFVIPDALQQLVQVSSEQLKKPLKVKFIGEEGVDEGGVKKEFFQIIIRELLDPSYAMFLVDEETQTLWFNSDSLESTMEFELIGILLGLAIYNGVILELHFPPLVYKKLMEKPITLEDLEKTQPALGKGLKQLLEFEGDVESVFQRAFEVSYEVYGEIKTVELVPNGKSINVTNANRKEYVDRYVQYVTTDSVAQQYGAFHRGFHLVCGGDALSLFRYEELELLICGSPELDFEALEQVTQYDDGFTESSPVITYFWRVVHSFSLEEKRQLLKFCTGSDRVPIRGLSQMMFVISRNGPDSNKLPTAHTCFNHLLLPEYSSEEKLRERLLIAISQSEGFGLL